MHLGAISPEECSEDCENFVGCSEPLQITVGYQDAVTGTMMCYLLCDDGDDDLEAIRGMCGEDAEYTEAEEASNRRECHEKKDCDSDVGGDEPCGTIDQHE